MSKTPPGKCKCQVKVKSGIKKVRKEYLQETISLLSLPAHSEVLTEMPHEVIQEVILVFLQLCVIHHKKKNWELQVVLLMDDELPYDGEI